MTDLVQPSPDPMLRPFRQFLPGAALPDFAGARWFDRTAKVEGRIVMTLDFLP